jgi:hypothetical protein
MVPLLNGEGGVFAHGKNRRIFGGRNMNIYFQTIAGIVRLLHLLTLKPVLSYELVIAYHKSH